LRHLKKWAHVFDKQSKDGPMISSSTMGYSVSVPAPRLAARTSCTNRRRSISPQAGHALELLGHALEYLTDEFVHEGGSFSAHNAQLEAVQLLMACNRAVYFACPEVPSIRERFSTFVHAHLF
jgi:hypothetical protein